MSTDPDRARILDELVADAAEQGGECWLHTGHVMWDGQPVRMGWRRGDDGVLRYQRCPAPGPDRALELLRELCERVALTGHFENAIEGDLWARARALVEDAKHE